MTKTANRGLMSMDERIHSEMGMILAALAVVVYGVSAPPVSDIGSTSSSVDSSPIQMLREQRSRVSGIQRNPEEERE
jgi:hypothetical protein